MERETHIYKGRYLKCRKNDWKGERSGRHDGAKECRYIDCAYRKQSGKEVKRGTLEMTANYSTVQLMEEKMG